MDATDDAEESSLSASIPSSSVPSLSLIVGMLGEGVVTAADRRRRRKRVIDDDGVDDAKMGDDDGDGTAADMVRDEGGS